MDLRKLILLIAGIALFVWFLYQSQIVEAFHSIGLINPFWLISIITVNLCVPLLKMMRWEIILSRFGISFRKLRTFGAVSAGFFLGLVTPATTGELGRAMIANMDKTIGISTVFFEKLLDLIVLLLVAISALIIHYLAQSVSLLAVISLWIGFVLLLLVLSRKSDTVERWGEFAIRNILPSRWRAKAARVQGVLNSLSRDFGLSVRCALYSLILWIIPGVQFYMITRAIGIDAGFEMVITSFFVPYLVGVLCLIPLGLGVLDFSVAGIMTKWYGVSYTLGNTSVIAFRLLVTSVLVIWGFAWYWYAILSKVHYKGMVLPDEACKVKES